MGGVVGGILKKRMGKLVQRGSERASRGERERAKEEVDIADLFGAEEEL